MMSNFDLFPEDNVRSGQYIVDSMIQAVRENCIEFNNSTEEPISELPEQEHQHVCRVTNGMHYAIRWCILPGCMSSWRMQVRIDDFGRTPIPEWEPIHESLSDLRREYYKE